MNRMFWLGIAVVFTPWGLAQETPLTPPAPTQTPPPAQTDAAQSDENKNRQTYKPSEEISEDLSVSFPVDI